MRWHLAKNGNAPQTLIVSSQEPETIWVPSWLKWTEVIRRLCAFVFSTIRDKDDASASKQRYLEAAQGMTLAKHGNSPQTLIVPE